MEGEDITDQALLVLHHQEQRLRHAIAAAAAAAAVVAGGEKGGWRHYSNVTPSDAAVEAYRSWLDLAGALWPCRR